MRRFVSWISFESVGVAPRHIALATCVVSIQARRNRSPQEVAKRGAFVASTGFTLEIVPDAQKVIMVMRLVTPVTQGSCSSRPDFFSRGRAEEKRRCGRRSDRYGIRPESCSRLGFLKQSSDASSSTTRDDSWRSSLSDSRYFFGTLPVFGALLPAFGALPLVGALPPCFSWRRAPAQNARHRVVPSWHDASKIWFRFSLAWDSGSSKVHGAVNVVGSSTDRAVEDHVRAPRAC